MREWRSYGIKQQQQLIARESREENADSSDDMSKPRNARKREREQTEESPNAEQKETTNTETTPIPRNHRRRRGGEPENAMAAWDRENSKAKIGRPYRQMTLPCSGITIDYLMANTRLVNPDTTLADGFRYLVGVAMHELAQAIEKQKEWSLGPFPHRGALSNKKTKEKEWLLVENATPREIFVSENAENYGTYEFGAVVTSFIGIRNRS